MDRPWLATLRVVFVLAAACAGLTTVSALAAPDEGEGTAAGEAAVKVRAVARNQSVAQGGELVIAVEMDLGKEYHAWPAASVKLPKDIDEFAIRTQVGLAKNEKGDVVVPAWVVGVEGVQYPIAHPGNVPDPNGESKPLSVPLYSHKAVSYLVLKIKPDAPLGEQTAEVLTSYQACNETMCLPPEDVVSTVKVLVQASGAAVGNENEPGLFKGFDAGKVEKVPTETPSATPAPSGPAANPSATTQPTTTPNTAAPIASAPSSVSLFGYNIGSSVLVVFFVSAIGGMVLNLTPCVLPVIPIKVLSLTQHAGSRRRAFILGLWMFAGVVVFWTLAGVPMAFISSQFDPSSLIFGVWWITFGIGLVIVLLGLGIMGMFTINLPQSVYMVDAKADSPGGSFMFGVMTAVLGLPCFGFVAGSLLAAAATLPWYVIMAIFVGIGFGMGYPYLILSAYPKLLKFIPRTGPASELVKQVMGILLLAAAAFFITAGISSLLKERPYLAGSMQWWAVGFFVAIAGVWLTIRTMQISKSLWPKLVMPVLAVVLTLGIGIFAQGTLNNDRKTYYARQEAVKSKTVPAGVWLEYTPELFAALSQSGRPVFLDFTADWCLTCKALKAAVLDPMASEFAARDIVLLEVDTTVRGGEGSRKLRELGRTGVPTWAIYPPGASTPVFFEVEKPTVGSVIGTLEKVGAKVAANP